MIGFIKKINDHRYEGDETIDKIQNRIAREMSILKVDEFESNKPKTMSEKALAEQIRLIDEKMLLIFILNHQEIMI